MKNLALLLSFVLLLSCQTSKTILFDNQAYEYAEPPGTLRITDYLYADQHELSNIDWLEFTYWVKRIYGEDSKAYRDIQPDQSVWSHQNHFDSLEIAYYSSSKYHYYPIVGVTLEQAKAYTDWRTDRVAEMILISKGMIEINRDQDSSNYFTLQRYIDGDYEGIIKHEDLVFPIYKIPSAEEWLTVAGINAKHTYGIDSLSKHNKEMLKVSNHLFNTRERLQFLLTTQAGESDLRFLLPYSNEEASVQNIFGLYHTIGNVAELIDDPGASKGGDWFHSIEDLNRSDDLAVNLPNCWTGFRNICYLELVRVND